MKKTHAPLLLLLLSATTALAVPAKKTTRTLILADGTHVVATLSGDENYHYWLGSDGTRYVAASDTSFVVLSDSACSALTTRAKAKASQSNQRRVQTRSSGSSLTGEKRGIVILVEFSDKSMTYGQSDFDQAFNLQGYDYGGSVGSVRDYFLSQSYQQLTIDFDVVGPYTLSNSMSYYGRNKNNGDDNHPAEMVIEAVQAANSSVDFSNYDWDGDGYVDQVFVVYAGYSEAQGASTNTIWPHEWNLSSAKTYNDGTGPQTLDGVIVDTYACANELLGTSGSTMEGIGTACHEFSHCLGLPDTYDTSGSNYGMGYWDVMDAGNYNGNGYVPAGFTSYERWFAGWLTPTELTSYTQIDSMRPLATTPEAYIIRNQGDTDEYYLLENRSDTLWDASLAASGLLVVHVDYDEDVWNQNTVNTTSGHERMTIVPADNVRSTATEAYDTWPQNGQTALTNSSTPAATLYNSNSDGSYYLNMPLRQITRNSDGSLSFSAGNIDVPTATEATDITRDGFTAHWQSVAMADSYRVVVTAVTGLDGPSTLLDDDFSLFVSTRDGINDISASLDNYTSQSGWSGSRVYTSPYGAKVGTSKTGGSLTTPTVSTYGSTVVDITAMGRDDSSSTLSVTDADGNSLATFTLSASADTFSLSTTAYGSLQLTLSSSSTSYVSSLCVTGYTAITDTMSAVTADTSVAFSGLDNSAQYSYVVYALVGSDSSEASNSVNVDLATPVSTAGASSDDNAIFDLSGRRLSAAPAHGVFIRGGRKFVR